MLDSGAQTDSEMAERTPPSAAKFSNLLLRRDVISWSLYDFANTIFSMNIVSKYFKPWLVTDLGRSGYAFDFAVALSMLAVALVSPALGALSDHTGGKKRYLLVFTLGCVLSVVVFGVIPPEAFFIIIIFFALSNFFYEGGMVFYNSLLYSVTENESESRYVSGYGVALGYVGAIVGLMIVLPFVEGNLFGVDVPLLDGSGRAGAFIPSAALFLVFASPLFLFVRERPTISPHTAMSLKRAYSLVWSTLKQTERFPGLLKFLIADFLIKNAITAVIINIGVFCLFVIGFDDAQTTVFLMIVTVAAVAGSYILGRVAVFVSLNKMIVGVALGWIILLALFGVAGAEWMFWVLSAAAGICLGGVWTLHRPYLGELAPPGELGRFFGLYSLTGKAAAVLGPLWWAVFFWLFESDGPLGSA
ncbi:MAG: MFS transporter, partial [Candidatus Zixiibacteriota bacterium]